MGPPEDDNTDAAADFLAARRAQRRRQYSVLPEDNLPPAEVARRMFVAGCACLPVLWILATYNFRAALFDASHAVRALRLRSPTPLSSGHRPQVLGAALRRCLGHLDCGVRVMGLHLPTQVAGLAHGSAPRLVTRCRGQRRRLVPSSPRDDTRFCTSVRVALRPAEHTNAQITDGPLSVILSSVALRRRDLFPRVVRRSSESLIWRTPAL